MKKTTVIISDDSRGNRGIALEEAIYQMGTQIVRFSANSLDIKPCTACSSCSGKTFGRCAIPDDMQNVLPKIVACQALVLISPVIFGGVSFHIKKVMDRMSAVGDPRYYYCNGELAKGMSNQGMNFYMVGIGDNLSETEKSAFLSLHEENRKIMNVKGQTYILGSKANQSMMERIAKEMIHGCI